jgi:crotonobetainyl-CoA:carnitine CoA-transferase CaiB-like acyl-CoA transferase
VSGNDGNDGNDGNAAVTAMIRRLPFAGVRIVDFTANMSGPLATMVLGDQGADVVKVEPPAGDAIRHLGVGVGDVSAYFANLNRSKRSLALDLSRPEAGPVVDALLDWGDVVVHNFRPAVAERLHLDAEHTRAGRPRLIHVAIDGFGPAGPYAGRPAYDHVIQALAGYAAKQADRETGEPTLIRNGVVDKATAWTAAQAISAALYERATTGEGQALQISMLDAAVAFLWPDGMMNQTQIDTAPDRPDITGSFRLTPTKDGHISFALIHARQWARLLDAFDLADDERLRGPDGRLQNRAVALREVRRRLGEMTTADAVAVLATYEIAVAPVLAVEDVAGHEQLVANGTVEELVHPVLGRIRQPNPPARFAGRRVGELRPAASLGEHNDEILGELGFSPATIAELRRAGVVSG